MRVSSASLLPQSPQRAAARLFRLSGARYAATGGFLFLLDYGLFLALAVLLGVQAGVAQACSRTAGAVTGFFGHKYFSFRVQPAVQAWSNTGQGVGYTVVTVGNLLASPILVHWTVALLGGRVLAGKLMVDAFLLVETYVVLRFVFRHRHRRRSP